MAGRKPLLVNADWPAGFQLRGEGVEVSLLPLPRYRRANAAGQPVVPWRGRELDAVDPDDPQSVVGGPSGPPTNPMSDFLGMRPDNKQGRFSPTKLKTIKFISEFKGEMKFRICEANRCMGGQRPIGTGELFYDPSKSSTVSQDFFHLFSLGKFVN